MIPKYQVEFSTIIDWVPIADSPGGASITPFIRDGLSKIGPPETEWRPEELVRDYVVSEVMPDGGGYNLGKWSMCEIQK